MKKIRITTAAMQESTLRRSRNRWEKKPGMVMAPILAEYRRRRLGHAAQVGQAGQTHEQVAAHVRGLGAHGGDDGTQFAAAQVELVGAGAPALPAAIDPHQHHGDQIDHNGRNDTELGCCHGISLSSPQK